MGDEIVARLVEAGLVHDVADFYRLTPEQLAALDMGRVKKDGTPVVLGRDDRRASSIAQIEASRHRPLSRLLFGLGIRHVGSTVAEVLARRVPLARRARGRVAPRRSRRVEGVGPKIADVGRRVLRATPTTSTSSDGCEAAGVEHGRGAPASSAPQTLAGLTFVLTGALERFTRDEATRRAQGAAARRSRAACRKKTTFVVVGRRPGQQVRQGARARACRCWRGRARCASSRPASRRRASA